MLLDMSHNFLEMVLVEETLTIGDRAHKNSLTEGVDRLNTGF
jgi:hypothetical protein